MPARVARTGVATGHPQARGREPATWKAGGAPYLRFKELSTRVADLIANAPRMHRRQGDPTDLARSTRRDFSRNRRTGATSSSVVVVTFGAGCADECHEGCPSAHGQ